MTKELNIDEFWSKRYPHGRLPKYAKEIVIEFAKEVLELAAENAEAELRFKGILNSVDKHSILDTINQIK